MRPEDLQVNLRPRSPWEAMELGSALLRRHAAAVWRPWLLATLAVALAANAVAWWLGVPWLGIVLAAWLKPALERIPLYVLSRAVFGQVPGALATLRAQPRFAPATLPAHLLWRRFGPARSLLLPVDLLEGNSGNLRTARRHAVGTNAYAQACVLTTVCLAFELVLALGGIGLVLLFVPQDLLQAWWRSLGWPPPQWLWLVAAALLWIAAAVVGPFHVAAGFGMYLNRRSESEAWDLELAFRRMRRRLLAQGAPLLLALLAALPLAARVADAPEPEDAAARSSIRAGEDGPTLPRVFGEQLQDDAGFRRAAARAYRDPQLGRERVVMEWKRRAPRAQAPLPTLPPWLRELSGVVAWLAESGLWLLLGALLLLLVLTARRWLPWLRGGAGRLRRLPAAAMVEVDADAPPEALPEDIPAAVRRLWSGGSPRAALALLYRASVVAMAARTRVELPPGATEAQCLRAAAALAPDAGRTVFARTVRTWQYAAYAGSLPDAAAFEALVEDAGRCWGWRA
ncbi:DUF4129 domain-containing protein [Pseudoxanthomonas sp. SGNA-20]|uniref:DUF4129 domain-containing protein n=1 Tax=Pseudoxanthomonas sp. SGNA-20 TaxID=2493088 RepID=UPI000F638E91|nr:DUF4129 domain-containing protein [Pseudoxanthomonas sp. SGNA-20]RRN55556.1 DUF4129 domain-containing protein [Pseudoxanthomonas sp. SGNA-20]